MIDLQLLRRALHTRNERYARAGRDLAEVREAAAMAVWKSNSSDRSSSLRGPRRTGSDPIGLLEAVHEVPSVERIRFASPHPRHFSLRILHALKRLPRFVVTFTCRCSRDRRVLDAMRRRYSRERYLEFVDDVRERMPDGAIHRHDRRFPGRRRGTSTTRCRSSTRSGSTASTRSEPSPAQHAGREADGRRREDDEKTRRIVALQALRRDLQAELDERLLGLDLEVPFIRRVGVATRSCRVGRARCRGQSAVDLIDRPIVTVRDRTRRAAQRAGASLRRGLRRPRMPRLPW